MKNFIKSNYIFTLAVFFGIAAVVAIVVNHMVNNHFAKESAKNQSGWVVIEVKGEWSGNLQPSTKEIKDCPPGVYEEGCNGVWADPTSDITITIPDIWKSINCQCLNCHKGYKFSSPYSVECFMIIGGNEKK